MKEVSYNELWISLTMLDEDLIDRTIQKNIFFLDLQDGRYLMRIKYGVFGVKADRYFFLTKHEIKNIINTPYGQRMQKICEDLLKFDFNKCEVQINLFEN